MLPEVDAVIYVDVDVVFVRPVEYVWQNFIAMNAREIAAMAVDTTKRDDTRNAFVAATPTSTSLGEAEHHAVFSLLKRRQFTRLIPHGLK